MELKLVRKVEYEKHHSRKGERSAKPYTFYYSLIKLGQDRPETGHEYVRERHDHDAHSFASRPPSACSMLNKFFNHRTYQSINCGSISVIKPLLDMFTLQKTNRFFFVNLGNFIYVQDLKMKNT